MGAVAPQNSFGRIAIDSPSTTPRTPSGPLWPYQSSRGPASHDPADLEPFDPREYLYERYASRAGGHRLLRAYYALRPLIPRRVQLAARRAYAPVQRTARFPAWPIEPILVEGQYEQLRSRLRVSAGQPIPFVNFWPDAKRFCSILTHDVESSEGIEAIPRLLEVEQRLGFVSSWNFCAEEYEIPAGLFEELRAAGCEVGLHGIRHDGKLFASRGNFEANLPKIHRYLDEWQAEGFRSPATHRVAEWMPELRSVYDSSFPDTDPFEPLAGGCCSIFPFFIEGMVELPITLAQDHTWFEILGHRSTSAWTLKSEWIIRHHGLINLIVHPDYMLSAERLELYESFLRFLRAQEGGWHALPREVAQWWKTRSALDVETVANAGGGADHEAFRPTISYAAEESGEIAFTLTGPPPSTGRFASDGRASPAPQASDAAPHPEKPR